MPTVAHGAKERSPPVKGQGRRWAEKWTETIFGTETGGDQCNSRQHGSHRTPTQLSWGCTGMLVSFSAGKCHFTIKPILFLSNHVTWSGAAEGTHHSFQDIQLEESKDPHTHPKAA